MTKGKFDDAAKKFEDVDRDHPYSPEARRAIVMAAYAYYKAGKYPEAIASAERYTTLHPGTKEAPLAHHIIASANFDEIKDPTATRRRPARRSPSSRRSRRAIPTAPTPSRPTTASACAEDTLAAQEMNVGRYYLKRNNQVAAINRYKTVVTEYQTTAHVEEALYRLTEANMSLGIASEAQTAAAVLGHNFPNSSWYKERLRAAEEGGPAAGSDQRLLVCKHLRLVAEEGAAGCDAAAARRPTGGSTARAAEGPRPLGARGPAPPSTLGGPEASMLGGPRT